MKFLGYPRSPIKAYLEEREGLYTKAEPPNWLVSHGYRRLVTPEELAQVPPGHAINCHIGYLPFGRGADPNFWAWLGDEPHGVTVHVMDEGLDTGPILGQVQVQMSAYDHTFRTSYHRLQASLYALFPCLWEQIREGKCESTPQPTWDVVTRTTDAKVPYLQYLNHGWDTRIEDFLQRVIADAQWPRQAVKESV